MRDYSKGMRRKLLFCVVIVVMTAGAAFAAQSWYKLPKLPPPYQYGNVLISRNSAKNGLAPVAFSHWRHRLKYTCRVCHLELEFEMKVNTTDITEEKNRNGQFCGACHNGSTSFGHTDKHCDKCHSGDITYTKKYSRSISRLPRDRYGNRVDWVKAVERRRIRPKLSILDENFQPMEFEKMLYLDAKWSMVPPSIFPHNVHVRWLDCANCHPDVFMIKKSGTEHFLMQYILEGKFCGVCHLNVAFPIDDCKRCHPGIKGVEE